MRYMALLVLGVVTGCGGGGGGGSGGLPGGSAVVTVKNLALADDDHVSDGSCGGSAVNAFTLVLVTVQRVSDGAFSTYTFNLAPGAQADIPGGLEPGTYTFEADYQGSVFHETDACPGGSVLIATGPNQIDFEY